MNKGIVIIALKKKAYSCGAFNLALSIKYYNPNIHITLLSDNEHMRHYGALQYSVFDYIQEIPKEDYYDDQFQPALAKFSFYKHSPYDHTLYIDADSLCLKDLYPLLEELSAKGGYIYSNVLGTGKKEDVIPYSVWATNNQVWDYFNLKDDATLYNINSSWIYTRKCKEADRFFQILKHNYLKEFGIDNLLHQWGGSYPDELFYNGTIAQLEIDPTFSNNVIFFGNEFNPAPVSELHDNFYLFTLYGKGTGITTVKLKYIEFYDKLLFKMCAERGHEHLYKAHELLKGKHINK